MKIPNQILSFTTHIKQWFIKPPKCVVCNDILDKPNMRSLCEKAKCQLVWGLFHARSQEQENNREYELEHFLK